MPQALPAAPNITAVRAGPSRATVSFTLPTPGTPISPTLENPMSLSISGLIAPLISLAKQDTAKLIVPLVVTFLQNIAANPNELNILAQLGKLEADVLAALPTIEQDELKALATLLSTEAQALLSSTASVAAKA